MLIGLVASQSAGKSVVANYLIEKYQYSTVPETVDTATFILEEERWKENWVFYPEIEDCEAFMKRPFFLLVYIDAPIMLRYKRYTQKLKDVSSRIPVSLEEFVMNHDSLHQSTLFIMHHADLKLLNSYTSLPELYNYLNTCDLTNSERCRPSWDTYFIKLCDWSARRSNCMKRRVGCILVKNNRIIATGYNGTPRGVRNCNEGGCPRCNSGAKCGMALDQCLCIHAEENALIEAGRERIESNGGITLLYCSTCPCLGCAKKIIQAGVKEVVYYQEYGMDALTDRLFKEAGVIMRQYRPVLDVVHDLIM